MNIPEQSSRSSRSSSSIKLWQATLALANTSVEANEKSVIFCLEEETLLGREDTCQIVLDSTQYSTVSRQHAKVSPISEDGQVWQVCDLAAANGTYINGRRLEKKGCHPLQSGDRILLSREGPEFVFECQPISVPVSSVVTDRSDDSVIPVAEVETQKQVTPVVAASTLSPPQAVSSTVPPTAPGVVISSCSSLVGSTQKSLWNLVIEENVRSLSGHSEAVRAVAFSPDGRTLASGSTDKTIKLWDLSTGESIQTLMGHRFMVNTVAFSPDGRTLASGSADKTIKLWDLSTGEPTQTLSGHTMAVNAIAFSNDGKILASGGSDKEIKLWNLSMGELTQTLSGHRLAVNAVAFNPDGKTLASSGADRTIKLWNLSTGEEAGGILGLKSIVNSLVFNPDGTILAGSSSDDKSIRLWNLETEQEIRALPGYGWQVSGVAISRDGRTFACGGEGNFVKIWQL